VSLKAVAACGVATTLILGSILWVERDEVVLSALDILTSRSLDVGPEQSIAWSTGANVANRELHERPPNIVLILADDLGWNDLSFGGGGVGGGSVPTPHIDSIAAAGAHFTNAYAANATCAPSRAALMSGRYPTRFGFEFTPTAPVMGPIMHMLTGMDERRRRNLILRPDPDAASFETMGMPASEITIAELLRQRGYHTLHIGKWHLGRVDGMAPHEQGFDESLLMHHFLYLPVDDPDVVNARQDFDPIDRILWRSARHAASFNGGPPFQPSGYLTDYFSDEAVAAIEANRDRPFFLYLAHWAPHTPLQATRSDYAALSHIELHRERVYAAMIRALDRSVGRVLDALRRSGLEENTLVVFTSDNGGAGYVGLPHLNAPFRGWKLTFFEGGIHVPYFIKWPARLDAGARFDAPVHHFDFFATAAAAAGAELPDDRKIDGVDLLPYLRGKATGAPHRALFWRSGASRSALVGSWKLNVSDPPGRKWLFDLEADPTEQLDLSESHHEKLAELEAALAEHDSQQMEPSWQAQVIIPVNIDKDLSLPDAAEDVHIYWSN